jgi:hypothetical protein
MNDADAKSIPNAGLIDDFYRRVISRIRGKRWGQVIYLPDD